MNQNAYPFNPSGKLRQDKPSVPLISVNNDHPALVKARNSRVAVVTMDRSQWSRTSNSAMSKYRWIFWLAVLLSAAILFGSCKNNGAADSRINAADTAGLAAYNAQKAADSLTAAQNGENQDERQDQSSAVSKDASHSANTGGEDAGAIKSVNDDNGNSDQYASDNSEGGSAINTETEAGTGSADNDKDYTETSTATTAKKKKFSSASKGAVIGAGSGAVLGAIISKKNRGLGAVIGAAVGGGAGYGIGKHKDNKKAKEGE